jgi:NTE family protein
MGGDAAGGALYVALPHRPGFVSRQRLRTNETGKRHMTAQGPIKTARAKRVRSPEPKHTTPCSAYERTVLVMQGGGALGSYQAGAYEVLNDHGIRPDWIAGISIGAVNAALIVGNPPEMRVAQMKAFWREITATFAIDRFSQVHPFFDINFRQMSGFMSMIYGVEGFYRPWSLPPWYQASGTPQATSFYDTDPLKKTLEKYVDFDLINEGEVRLSLGAVNVKTGNFVYFDNRGDDKGVVTRITADHVLASGALPPGFPAVEIDGETYWDGGVVSNTPLSYVLEGAEKNSLVFQMDLFSSQGPVPRTIDEVQERAKDVLYSSRTRLNTDAFREKYQLRRAISALLEAMPAEARKLIDPRIAEMSLHEGRVSIVHLINRGNRREIQSKDYEFSRIAMEEHWRDGHADANAAMLKDTWRDLPDPEQGIAIYDYTRPDDHID